MATYTLSTLYKKSSEVRDFWFKDGQVAIKTEGFRWGDFTKECDEHPDIDLSNPDGFEPTGEEWELVSLNDGCWGDWTWPDDMPQEERERLEALYDEEWYEGLEGEGWVQDDSETWLYGPLLLKNEDTGEEWRGTDPEEAILIEETPNPKLTDWFPGDVSPVRVGQYEVQQDIPGTSWPFPLYGIWTGTGWTKQDNTPLEYVSQWRGLAHDPESTK